MSAVLLAADNVNVAQNIGFGVIATLMIFAALSVVTTKNVVHAALWLVLVLGGVAAQYILAAAEFVAVSQVLVYIGAVMVLFLFGIMLTRARIGADTDLNNQSWALGIPVAGIIFGLLAYAILDFSGDDSEAERFFNLDADGVIVSGPDAQAPVTEAIADQVLSPYLIPFFGMTFVLLAAAIGAIVLARKD